MLIDQIKTHREVVTLKDGTYVLLRPMTTDDCDALIALYASANEEDVRYLRHDVRNAAVIRGWCADLDYSKVLPILALVKDRVIGNATLHFGRGPKRHIGEIRVFLARDYRRRGLGTKMIRSLIELARKHGLSLLTAEVTADMTKVVKAFEQLGFRHQCTIDDYFMFPDGECCDVVLLTMPLKPRLDEF